MGEMILFVCAAVLALGSAIVVVAHRNPVYSVMSLVVTLVSLATLFILLAAQFMAVLLVLVYAGAILVLFLFVIMLLNVGRESRGIPQGRLQRWGAAIAAVVFGGVLVGLQWGGEWADRLPVQTDDVSLKPIARMLFGEYLLLFEIAGVLLLAAVVAATVLARRPTPEETGGDV